MVKQNRNKGYDKKIAFHTSVIIGFAILLLLIIVVSLNTGYVKLSPLDTLSTLFGGGGEKEKLILFSFRMPRIVLSMLVGVGLALSGCIIQNISKNDLADPGLLGINAGAGLVVILYVMFFGSQSFLSIFTLPFLSLVGAGLTAILIYFLAFRKRRRSSSFNLVLNGVAVQAGISALTTVLVIKLDETQFDFVASWQAGSIWGSNWKFVWALLPWLLLLIPYVMSKSNVLNILDLDNDVARGIGVNVEKERRGLLAASVALAASSVAVSGSISFVGLLAPHLARKIVGPKHNILLPTCALTGAVLVSGADAIARVLLQPTEIPTGIAVAVIGAPYLLYLLIKGK
jgi:iron complex transport system permease protein